MIRNSDSKISASDTKLPKRKAKSAQAPEKFKAVDECNKQTKLPPLEPYAVEPHESDPNLGWLLFESASALIGLDCFAFDEPHAFLKYLFVREDERNSRIAERALEMVITRARSQGYRSLFVPYPEVADQPDRLLAALKTRGFALHFAEGQRVLYRKVL